MDKPNIVLINCDDLGYGDLGCYGSKVNRTPAIDRMAAEGMMLTDFYMASSVCSPSRGAMLTGCYPPRIGFGDFDGEWVLFPGQGVGLNPNETTCAAMLRKTGYRTKIVGKWHCGDQPDFLPLRHGFEEYYGLPYSNDMGRQKGREKNPPLPLIHNETVIQEQPEQRSLTERYVEQCTEFIHAHKNESFFLYFAHMHVHLPLYAPEQFVKNSQNGDYGACVECVDWATDCILHQLEKDGLTQNTLVIFTSDNGCRGTHGGSNGPLRGGKGTTWEGGQRVPCILYWPGHVPSRSTCSHIISSIDFLPTFAALSGAEVKKDVTIDGINFAPLLTGRSELPARTVFFYYFMNDLEAVRGDVWKLHVRKNGKQVKLLYNLEADIGENHNIYDQCPEVVKRLEFLLEECRKELGDAAFGVTGNSVRPSGRVEQPKPLTEYQENHPYIIAMYDSADIG